MSTIRLATRGYCTSRTWFCNQFKSVQECCGVAPRLISIPRRGDLSFLWQRKRGAFDHQGVFYRFASQSSQNEFRQKLNKVRHTSAVLYISGVTVLVIGLSYAAVPLYRIFCQSTGYGGEIGRDHDDSKISTMRKMSNRLIKVTFNADTASSMAWKFMPQQSEIYVAPGETALVFYTATNPLDVPVIGIATYNIVPFEAGQYFNKIQCFCFEEQRLNPHEQVDMPVFFYIDPDYDQDPKMENIDVLTLSYTFFEAKEGISIPVPLYVKR